MQMKEQIENCSFDPQALTSLTFIAVFVMIYHGCFDPQALTSLTLNNRKVAAVMVGFDPQALTSLTACRADRLGSLCNVSIHRLLRA